jgi:hypothetical protein
VTKLQRARITAMCGRDPDCRFRHDCEFYTFAGGADLIDSACSAGGSYEQNHEVAASLILDGEPANSRKRVKRIWPKHLDYHRRERARHEEAFGP